ncbi:unnamed protein product, partial [Prorocentrum cordatum]
SRYAGLPRAAASPSPPAPGGRRGARERRRMFAPQGHDPAHLPCAGFSTAGYPMGYNPMQTGMQTGMPGTAATTYYGAQPGGHVPATQPVYSSHHREEDYDQTFPQPMGTQMRMQQAADKRMRDSFQSNQSGCVGMNQLLLHQHKQRHRGTDPPRRPPVADTAVVGWLLRAPRGTGASHVLAEDHERWPASGHSYRHPPLLSAIDAAKLGPQWGFVPMSNCGERIPARRALCRGGELLLCPFRRSSGSHN